MAEFGERLAKLLSEQKLSQAELCRKTGIPKSAMSQYLSGCFKPRGERLETLAAVLGVSPAYLLGLEEAEKALPLSEQEMIFISYYRENCEFAEKVNLLLQNTQKGKVIFRAAKSESGKEAPTVERISPDHLKKLREAPETDEDL